MRKLQPGAVVPLGELQPGDVGEIAGFDGRFIVTEIGVPPWVMIQYDDGQRSAKTSGLIVRFFGPGRIVPARIVVNGELDDMAETVRHLCCKLAEAGVEGSPPPGSVGTIPELQERVCELESQVTLLRKWGKLLLDYTKSCEELINVSTSGQCVEFEAVLTETAPQERS